ncbi:hypothetical protein BG28_09685 [Nesterenkonia sp. AN1]|nr:hypothetical protein BG28_09685 [Nesterenkonia sp. AN1]
MAEEIAPEAEIRFLGSGSAEAHDLELTPGQRESLETADVVLYLGDIGYQTQVEEAAAVAEGEIVNTSAIAGDDRILAASEDPHAHGDHDDDHAHEEAVFDPHVWFDPSIMAEVAAQTGEAFAAADPHNAETYSVNAERVSDELLGTQSEIEELLGQECRFNEAIVSHAAYGYLLEPYGYTQHAVDSLTSGEGGASGNQLAGIVGEIEETGFEYLLAEPVDGRADTEAVARETGTELLNIYPLDVVLEDQADQGYPALLRAQAETFATALGCD